MLNIDRTIHLAVGESVLSVNLSTREISRNITFVGSHSVSFLKYWLPGLAPEPNLVQVHSILFCNNFKPLIILCPTLQFFVSCTTRTSIVAKVFQIIVLWNLPSVSFQASTGDLSVSEVCYSAASAEGLWGISEYS